MEEIQEISCAVGERRYAFGVETSKKIELLLADRGLSQAQLAKNAGVSAASISRMVGGADASISLLKAVAAALDVSVDWLLDPAQAFPPPSHDRLDSVNDAALFAEVIRRRKALRAILLSIRDATESLKRLLNEAGPNPERSPRVAEKLAELSGLWIQHERILEAWLRFFENWNEPAFRDDDFIDDEAAFIMNNQMGQEFQAAMGQKFIDYVSLIGVIIPLRNAVDSEFERGFRAARKAMQSHQANARLLWPKSDDSEPGGPE